MATSQSNKSRPRGSRARRWCSSCSRSLGRTQGGVDFAQRISFQQEDVGGVNQPVQDGIGDGGISQERMPLVRRNLTGHQRRMGLAAIIEDVEQVAALRWGERR